jgi:hypothetical protein
LLQALALELALRRAACSPSLLLTDERPDIADRLGTAGGMHGDRLRLPLASLTDRSSHDWG